MGKYFFGGDVITVALGAGWRCDVCFEKGNSLKKIFLIVIIPDGNVFFFFLNAMGNTYSGFLIGMTVMLCFGTLDSILRGNMRLLV